MEPRKIAVSEIFGPTIAGEGDIIGKPTTFVRTGSCDFRCSWCDTLYAVLPEYREDWIPMTAEEVFAKVQALSPDPILITLSGGNPAMQPLEEFIQLSKDKGYTHCIETQGSISQPWFKLLDHITLSPKPPSSGMKTNWKKINKCLEASGEAQVIFKVVVFDELDYCYAKVVSEHYPKHKLYLQAGNPLPPHLGEFSLDRAMRSYEWLVNKTLSDKWNTVTILPQLHTWLWANKRGV